MINHIWCPLLFLLILLSLSILSIRLNNLIKLIFISHCPWLPLVSPFDWKSFVHQIKEVPTIHESVNVWEFFVFTFSVSRLTRLIYLSCLVLIAGRVESRHISPVQPGHVSQDGEEVPEGHHTAASRHGGSQGVCAFSVLGEKKTSVVQS